MAQWLTRVAATDLEVRSDGRSIYGVVVPFDSPATITENRLSSYEERFAYGAFSRLVADPASVGRVKLLAQHDRTSNPLGRATELREEPRGLVGTFRISNTNAGQEALELVRDGALDAFSVGFLPVRSEWNSTKTSVVRREAKLREVSLVTFGAYADALVGGVRTASTRSLSRDDALARLRLLESL